MTSDPDDTEAASAPTGETPAQASTTASDAPASNALQRTMAVVGVAILAGIAMMVVLAPLIDRAAQAGRPGLVLFVRLKILVSTFNVVVLLVLAGTYASLYRDLPNQFTGSLVLFSLALLLYALTSNPLVQIVFGFRGGGLGPFTVLPDLFAALAVVALLYQSYR